MARKTMYEEERCCLVARAMTRLGAIDSQIAAALGIRLRTLDSWKTKYPALVQALKEGKAVADSRVEDGLFQRALGYEYTETKVIKDSHVVQVTVQVGEETKVLPAQVVRTEVVKKSMAPDVTAQIFWLKNRRPDLWRDVQGREHSGPNGGPVRMNLDAIGDLEVRKELDQLRRLVARRGGGNTG